MRRCIGCSSLLPETTWACTACGFSPAEKDRYLSFVSGDNDDGFEGEFFEALAEYEPGFWWFESRNDLIVWALERWFPEMTSFLEVGCGTGFVVSRLAREFTSAKFSASELFADAMGFVANRISQAALYQFDARNMPFRDEFDVIGAFDVIEHIDEDEAVLTELRLALKPAGGLILTVPQHPFLWGPSDDFAHHKRRYTRGILRERLERSGYEVLALRSFVSLLMPLQIVSRIASRHSAAPDPRDEFRIPAIANQVLSGIMSLERHAIAAGADSPFGGSLLAVARRGPVRT